MSIPCSHRDGHFLPPPVIATNADDTLVILFLSAANSDLAKFISAGRLNCSIDKVNGVVETNRPDIKNARYEQAIKQGDVLLNSLQKLSRVIG